MKDLARSSTVTKRALTDQVQVHPGMAGRTNTSVGAPPRDNNPPDASSPLPTDPTKQHGSKKFAVPALHPAMKSDPERGSYRPKDADDIMGGAVRPAADFAATHHTLPVSTKEN